MCGNSCKSNCKGRGCTKARNHLRAREVLTANIAGQIIAGNQILQKDLSAIGGEKALITITPMDAMVKGSVVLAEKIVEEVLSVSDERENGAKE